MGPDVGDERHCRRADLVSAPQLEIYRAGVSVSVGILFLQFILDFW